MIRIPLVKPTMSLRWALLPFFAALVLSAPAQPSRSPAPPANTDEAKVGTYTLPDPLKMSDGTPVTTPRQWLRQRRPEILSLFEHVMYGRGPGKLDDLKFEVSQIKKDALGGKATRKLVHVSLAEHPAWKGMDLMIYIPKGAKKPVPSFAGLSFGGNHAVSTEKDVPPPKNWASFTRSDNKDPESARSTEASSWPIETILARGYAVATAWYCDIEPDRPDGWKVGLRGALARDKKLTANWDPDKDWSAIGAWAWGLSRTLDYLKTDRYIDAKKVAVVGHSRLGKTSSWAGASDPRFSIVISNDSGEGGMAISRRHFGESVASMNKAFPHWFCARHWDYINKENELPVDAHMLAALVAPRPLYIASASEDLWADPHGEFLAGKAAEPVYALFGEKGLGVAEWPAPDHPIGDFIGYHLRTGKHAMTAYDWAQYLNFADRHFSKR